MVGSSVAIDGDTALVEEPNADVVRDNTLTKEQLTIALGSA